MSSDNSSFHVSANELDFPTSMPLPSVIQPDGRNSSHSIQGRSTELKVSSSSKNINSTATIQDRTDLKTGGNLIPAIESTEVPLAGIPISAKVTGVDKRKMWLEKSAIYVLTSFCNRKSIDVDSEKKLRSNSTKLLPRKTVQVNNLSIPFRNPFVLSKISSLTEVQKLVRGLFGVPKVSTSSAGKENGELKTSTGTSVEAPKPMTSSLHMNSNTISSSSITSTDNSKNISSSSKLVSNPSLSSTGNKLSTNDISAQIDVELKPQTMERPKVSTESGQETTRTIIKRSVEDAEMLGGEFPHRGSVAVNASCGSGKTFAGIYCIYKFQCKTLIISTRNAVIDQWVRAIEQLYPGIKIWSSEKKGRKSKIPLPDYDIWITTPQYLNAKGRIVDKDFNLKPSLIIYDEIHTMLSETSKKGEHDKEFLNVLKFPFIRCLNKDWDELPYMLGLSATYPKDNKLIERIFGVPKHINCSITKIGIEVWDTRDYIQKRGKCDMNYSPYSQQEALVYFLMHIPFMRDGTRIKVQPKTLKPKIPPMEFDPIEITPKFKGLVVTKNINESVWAALFVHKILHANVLLIRTNDVASYYFSMEKPVMDRVSQDVTYDDLSKFEWGTPCKYTEHIEEAEVIVSTTSRLKEGFSVRNLTWGICCQFMYSVPSRVQLLGRIRRSSEDEELNKRRRIFYVNSGIVPSDLYIGKRKRSNPEPTYDWEFERELFERENIHYISPHVFGEETKDKK